MLQVSSMTKIFLLAPTQEIYEQAKKLKKSPYPMIEIHQGLIQDAVATANQKSHKTEMIFISRGRTSAALRNSFPNNTVIDIAITPYDILRGLLQAKKQGKKIALLAFSEMLGIFEEFQTLLEIDLAVFYLENEGDANQKVDELILSGFEVIIGGETTRKATSNKPIAFIQIETGEEAIKQSIEYALQIGKIRSFEQTKTKLLETLSQHTSDSLILLDPDLKITLANPNFYEQISLPESEVLGKSIHEIWPGLKLQNSLKSKKNSYSEIIQFKGMDVLCNKIFVWNKKSLIGLVISFQEVVKIQKMESKLRRSLYTSENKVDQTFDDILGSSPVIQQTIQIAKKLALSNSPIIITGETGVGKKLFAQSIHHYSKRSTAPFLQIKCSALNGENFSKELLGQIENNKSHGKPGAFEIAHKGTLFLEEISELDWNAQGKLLLILQKKIVSRLGGTSPLPIDVRLIASTTKDINNQIKQGLFRAHLFYHLNVLHLHVPSLKSRREDISIISKEILKKSAQSTHPLSFSEETLWALQKHHWQGNVKELSNIIERLAITTPHETITYHHFSEAIQQDFAPPSPAIKELIQQDQIELLRNAIKEAKGNYGVAAKKLGINRSTLWRRMKKYGLK